MFGSLYLKVVGLCPYYFYFVFLLGQRKVCYLYIDEREKLRMNGLEKKKKWKKQNSTINI
jgi:hypothetical protein